MYLVWSSLLFGLPIFFKQPHIKVSSFALMTSSVSHHYFIAIGKRKTRLDVIDNVVMYYNIIISGYYCYPVQIIPWSICLVNIILLYYFGILKFGYYNRFHAIEWYHGSMMHTLMHLNGLFGLLLC